MGHVEAVRECGEAEDGIVPFWSVAKASWLLWGRWVLALWVVLGAWLLRLLGYVLFWRGLLLVLELWWWWTEAGDISTGRVGLEDTFFGVGEGAGQEWSWTSIRFQCRSLKMREKAAG